MTADDRGSAVVWSMALVGVLLAAAVVASGVGSVALLRVRASTVADLAAIAATVSGDCDSAAAVAGANGMALSSCSIQGADIVVTVVAQPPVLLVRISAWTGQAHPILTASARAGFVSEVPAD